MSPNTGPVWPAVQSVEVKWTRDEYPAGSRRQALKHRGPYSAALVSPIAGQVLILRPELQTAVEDAAIELARFDAEVGRMVTPFASMLMRSEAASSSQIENLTSSPSSVLKAEFGLGETPNATLIVSNQLAMKAAIEASEDLSVDSLLQMHRTLMFQADPENAGRLRDQAVWIGGSNLGPHGADYIAPEASAVPDLMSDLIAFSRRLDLPAIAQVALAHAQFETIHPFTDGNGRTGRALVQAMLHRLGVTANVTVPVSAGLLQDTARYFEALNSYRLGLIEPIISVFADAARDAIANGRQLASDLHTAEARWRERLTVRSDSGAAKLVARLMEQPVISSASAVEILGTTPANAQLAIDKLVELGILRQLGSGARNRLWQATDVIFALDDFAERIKRK
jgi:Fic family protein